MGLLRWLWQRLFHGNDREQLGRLEARLEKARERAPAWHEHSLRKLLQIPLGDVGFLRSRWGVREALEPLSGGDRRRLNSLTMRTVDEQKKTLATDWVQLQRFGLPVWYSESELAESLGVTLGELRWFASHRNRDPVSHYVRFTIPKRDGSTRQILAPKPRLKQIQRHLLQHVVDRLPVHDAAHGFRKGRSIATSAALHVGQDLVLTMDLRDFFASVHFFRVRGLLMAYGYGFPVATTLATLMTEANRHAVPIEDGTLYQVDSERYCVQGAPTSPGLCNAIACRLDRRLQGLSNRLGWNYSRYADDLTFSGSGESARRILMRVVPQICEEEGFTIHPNKTRIARRGRCQRVTGVVVNDVLGLSRKDRRRLRAAAHRLRRESQLNPRPDDFTERLNMLRGYVAYLSMLNPDQARQLKKCWPGVL